MTRRKEATHAYIGIDARGSIRAICYDDPGLENETAAIIGSWPGMGRTTERVTVDELSQRLRPPTPTA
jgi:hypothetical protein